MRSQKLGWLHARSTVDRWPAVRAPAAGVRAATPPEAALCERPTSAGTAIRARPLARGTQIDSSRLIAGPGRFAIAPRLRVRRRLLVRLLVRGCSGTLYAFPHLGPWESGGDVVAAVWDLLEPS